MFVPGDFTQSCVASACAVWAGCTPPRGGLTGQVFKSIVDLL